MEPLASLVVLGALHDIRFQLGLVNSAHLVARLVGQGVPSRSAGDATQLLCAWGVRRLSSGMEPQVVADSLVSMRGRLAGCAADAISDVLAFFCLDGRPTRTRPNSADEPRPRTRTLSRLSLRSAKRRTLPIPHWLSPRQHPVKVPRFDTERRPSLPTLLASASQSTPSLERHDAEPISRRGTPMSDNSSPCSTPGLPGRHPSPLGRPSPLLNSLGLSDLPTERVALVDHLLYLRYRLGSDADSWYLGCGKDKAANFLLGVEAAGEPHVNAVVAQLRYAFGLVVVVIPADDQPLAPTAGDMTLHQRDVSFDLEQYLDDIGPVDGDDKESPGIARYSHSTSTPPRITSRLDSNVSISTISSVLSTDSTATMTTLGDTLSLSEFSIREVTREMPKSAKATTFRFPIKRSENVADDMCLPPLLPALNYPRFAKSMPNVNDVYTRLPTRTGRRRQSTKESRLPPLLPAFDPETNLPALGLRGVLPPTSFSPQFQPQHSPTMLKGYTFPPVAPTSVSRTHSRSDGFSLSPRRPSIDDGDRSRRQMYRQCVIVDGARHSPHASMLPSPRVAAQDLTALGTILTLFHPGAEHLGREAVERKLLEAVKNQEERLGSLGEPFDAEARARLAWLLEQVGQEVS